MFQLVIEDSDQRQRFPLSRDELSIGRSEDNEIHLPERNVSRRHARILREGERCYIEDRSRYGSRKNGRKFSGRTTLQPGDIVLIGDYRLQLVVEGADASLEATGPLAPDASTASARGGVEGATTVLPRRGSPPPMPGSAVAEALLPVVARSVLECLTPPYAGSRIELQQAVVLLGRGEDCHVVIEDPSISKHQARFVTRGPEVQVEDLGSTNAMLVNGRAHRSLALRGGEELQLGNLRFRFVGPGGAGASAAADAWAADADIPAARPGWLMPVLAGAGALAVVAVLWGVFGRGPSPGSEEQVVTVDDTGAHALRLATQHTNAARWSDALEALESIADGSPEAAQAATLREQAERELENQREYEAIRSLVDNGHFSEALRRVDALPRSSYYRTRADDEGLQRIILQGLIDQRLQESQEAQARGDSAEALRVVRDALLLAPEDARLLARQQELSQPQARTPIPAVAEPAEVRTPPREPAPQETAPRPVRTADAEPARTPPPARTTPEPARTPQATRTVVDDAPPAQVPRPRESFDDLLARARRLSVQRDWPGAVTLLLEAEQQQPGNAAVQTLLVHCYQNLNNPLRTARAMRRLIAIQPNHPRRAEYEAWMADNGL
jgi:pSer/pThr/pTyr-binding forkhead associated (FHA) protein